MQLYHLIKSLDPGEVRYVRAFAKRKDSDGSACLVLFDLIYRCKVYEEKKYAEKVDVANFPALKVYLRDLIADALLEKEMKKKGFAEISVLIGQIDIFHRKGFMQLMWARMEKALQLCERYEFFHLHRELLHKKQSILMLDSPPGHVPEGMEDFDDIYPVIQGKFRNLESYIELEQMVTIAARRGNTAMYEVATNLLSHPLMADNEPLLSVRAEIKYCFVKRNILRWTNQAAEAIKCSERVIAILDANPTLMVDEELYQIYASRIYDIGWYSAATGAIARANNAIKRLESLTTYPIIIYERLHSVELRLAMFQLDFPKGEEIVSKVSEGLELHEHRLSRDRKIAYYFQIAVFYLYFSEAKKALKWVQKLREEEFVSTKKDLQDFGEMLHLVCHFDLGNYKFLKNEAIKVMGYLRKKAALTPYEEAIASGIRKAAMATTEASRSNRLKRLDAEIEELKKQPQFAYKANYFQFNVWMVSKLSGGNPAIHLHTSKDKLT